MLTIVILKCRMAMIRVPAWSVMNIFYFNKQFNMKSAFIKDIRDMQS